MKLRKLTQEEVNQMESNGNKGARKELWAHYDTMIQEMSRNEWLELTLRDDESKAKVRHQINQSAERAGYTVEYKYSRGNKLIVRLLDGQPVPPPEIPIVFTNEETTIDVTHEMG